MADPLTSTDIIRERMGFGVSPLASQDTLRSYAAAGLPPLSAQDRERFKTGAGISPMAGPSEKDAWKMAEYMSGQREQAPVSYGGIGDRPVGTSRRQIRMQDEWDKRRAAEIEEQRALQSMEMDQRRFALSERNQVLQERQEARLQAAEAKAQEEILKVSEQADLALNEVLGGFDPAGSPVLGLDPDAPDYMQRRNDIIKRYPKALKDDAFKTTIDTTDKSYFDTENFNQQLQAQEQSSGRIIERQVSAEERAAKRQVEIREEERVAQEERGIVSQEREIDKQIRAQRQALAGLQGQKPTRSLEKASTEARNKLLDLRIERAALRGLVFETQEEADAAYDKLPKGSTVYIDRKPTKVN
jgi:hypothetical protein